MAKLGVTVSKPLPEHLEVPWGPWQAVWVAVAAWLIMPALAVVVLVALAQSVPGAHSLLNALNANSLQFEFGLDVLTAVTALGMVALYLRKYKVGWASVGWRKFSPWKALGYFALGFVGFLILATVLIVLVSLLVPGFNANQAQSNDFTNSVKTNHGLTLLALVILPPIIEETVFRGFLFPAIAKKWGTVWGAVVSSALFGLAHWQANVSIYTCILGLVLCFLYVKLKSIFPGMAIHMLNNFLAYYALSAK